MCTKIISVFRTAKSVVFCVKGYKNKLNEKFVLYKSASIRLEIRFIKLRVCLMYKKTHILPELRRTVNLCH